MRRFWLLVVTSGAVAIAGSSVASAALTLRFARATAHPGELVSASQPGFGSRLDVDVYLVPVRLPGAAPDGAGMYLLDGVPERGAVRLGRLVIVAATSGKLFRIRFRLPHVPPGDYTTAFWCHTCRKGGDFFASVPYGEPWTGRAGGVLRVTR